MSLDKRFKLMYATGRTKHRKPGEMILRPTKQVHVPTTETYEQYCARCAAAKVEPLPYVKWDSILVKGKFSM